MKELALYLVRNLVHDADKVDAEVSEQDNILRLNLRVSDEDKGKIIGKQGKVIKAIRSVVGIAAAQADRKVLIDLE